MSRLGGLGASVLGGLGPSSMSNFRQGIADFMANQRFHIDLQEREKARKEQEDAKKKAEKKQKSGMWTSLGIGVGAAALTAGAAAALAPAAAAGGAAGGAGGGAGGAVGGAGGAVGGAGSGAVEALGAATAQGGSLSASASPMALGATSGTGGAGGATGSALSSLSAATAPGGTLAAPTSPMALGAGSSLGTASVPAATGGLSPAASGVISGAGTGGGSMMASRGTAPQQAQQPMAAKPSLPASGTQQIPTGKYLFGGETRGQDILRGIGTGALYGLASQVPGGAGGIAAIDQARTGRRNDMLANSRIGLIGAQTMTEDALRGPRVNERNQSARRYGSTADLNDAKTVTENAMRGPLVFERTQSGNRYASQGAKYEADRALSLERANDVRAKTGPSVEAINALTGQRNASAGLSLGRTQWGANADTRKQELHPFSLSQAQDNSRAANLKANFLGDTYDPRVDKARADSETARNKAPLQSEYVKSMNDELEASLDMVNLAPDMSPDEKKEIIDARIDAFISNTQMSQDDRAHLLDRYYKMYGYTGGKKYKSLEERILGF